MQYVLSDYYNEHVHITRVVTIKVLGGHFMTRYLSREQADKCLDQALETHSYPTADWSLYRSQKVFDAVFGYYSELFTHRQRLDLIKLLKSQLPQDLREEDNVQ